MFTYQDYLKEENTLSFQEAETIYNTIIKDATKNDKDFYEHWNDVLAKAIKYANIRAMWHTSFSQTDRIEKDDIRTSAHDSFITNLNMLVRYMESQGKDISWITTLGSNRKRIGDFACYLAYIYSINSR